MQPIVVTELDFLPAAYRQQSLRRRSRRWRAALFVAGMTVLAAAWTYRVVDYRAAQRGFDELSRAHNEAVKTQRQCEEAQRKLERANQEAALITYLKHPWATSQTLASIIKPMPDTVRLTEVRIIREPIGGKVAQSQQKPNTPEKPNDKAPKLPPAVEDLKLLREEYDAQQVVVLLSGETVDGDALHRYIRRLSTGDLFSAAELSSLQRETSHSKHIPKSQFQARAVLQPAIGQPGGIGSSTAKTQLARSGDSDATDKVATRTSVDTP